MKHQLHLLDRISILWSRHRFVPKYFMYVSFRAHVSRGGGCEIWRKISTICNMSEDLKENVRNHEDIM